MKRLLTFLTLLLPLCLMAQQPPILRQSLTTNTASAPTMSGHIPIWNGVSWIPGFASTATATNITLPVILLPGSTTNDAINSKVAVAGNGVTFTTNQTTNLVVSVSADLTNLINNIGGEIWWTNFTATDFAGGTVYGIADTNRIASSASLAVNFLTNAVGDPSSFVLLGVQTSGGAFDQRQIAGSIIGIGDDALQFTSFTNATRITAIGPQAMDSAILDNAGEIIVLGRSLFNSTVTNSSKIYIIGTSAAQGADIWESSSISVLGESAFRNATVSNSAMISAIGNGALRESGIETVWIRDAGKISAFGDGAMENAIIQGSTNILAIGTEAAEVAKITNSIGITFIGSDAGTNLVITAKTNVMILGNVGSITPANEEIWFANSGSRYRMPGIATSGGITNNGIYQHTNGAFTGGLFVSSNAAGVAYWTTNIASLVVTNLYNSNGVPITVGGGGDTLWTNTANQYLPTQTNTFGFAKESGGLWLGKNATNYWGHLGPDDSLISIRSAVAANPDGFNNNFAFISLPGAGITNSISGNAAGGNASLLVSGYDTAGFGSALLNADTTGLSYLTLTSNNVIGAHFANNGPSFLNGGATTFGIGTAVPDAELHVVGEIFTSGGITNAGGYKHTTGAGSKFVFVDQTGAGDAGWTNRISGTEITNSPNISVTNINLYANIIFNNNVVSNFNRDINWTNDGTVLKPTGFGLSPNNSLRFGSTVSSGAESLLRFAPRTIAFGDCLVEGEDSSVLGGRTNRIQTNAVASVISGGATNRIDTNSFFSVIAGGQVNTILTNIVHGTIGGGALNVIHNNGTDSTIAGGDSNQIGASDATVSGGAGNVIGLAADQGTIAGGNNNLLTANAKGAVISGGTLNTVSARWGNIAGGRENSIGNAGGVIFGNTIGGGAGNSIATGVSSTSSNSVIAGGRGNVIGDTEVHNSVISGGSFNNVGDNSTNAVIGGGDRNTITGAPLAQIHGGFGNTITSAGDWGFIYGNSNRVAAAFAGVFGDSTTNSQASSLNIGFGGLQPTVTTMTSFTTSNTIIRTSLATAPSGTIVTLAADNQVVDVTLRTHVRLASDTAVAGDRTFLLTGTNVAAGAHAILEWTGTNAGELVDDAANSGAGNIRLSATWTPTQYDTLSLIFNGTDWVEMARSTN